VPAGVLVHFSIEYVRRKKPRTVSLVLCPEGIEPEFFKKKKKFLGSVLKLHSFQFTHHAQESIGYASWLQE
jgi:hypothetical protein